MLVFVGDGNFPAWRATSGQLILMEAPRAPTGMYSVTPPGAAAGAAAGARAAGATHDWLQQPAPEVAQLEHVGTQSPPELPSTSWVDLSTLQSGAPELGWSHPELEEWLVLMTTRSHPELEELIRSGADTNEADIDDDDTIFDDQPVMQSSAFTLGSPS